MDIVLANQIGCGLAIAGAGLAVGLGCAGSGRGIGIASQAMAGVLSEKPDLFGRLLVLLALPGTQGFYGFITALMIFMRFGLTGGSPEVSVAAGLAMLVVGFGVGLALMVSATWQGEASAASIGLVARRRAVRPLDHPARHGGNLRRRRAAGGHSGDQLAHEHDVRSLTGRSLLSPLLAG